MTKIPASPPSGCGGARIGSRHSTMPGTTAHVVVRVLVHLNERPLPQLQPDAVPGDDADRVGPAPADRTYSDAAPISWDTRTPGRTAPIMTRVASAATSA